MNANATRGILSTLPVPEDELFFQIITASHMRSTLLRVSRQVVVLKWNIAGSRVFNANQKAAIVSGLRRLVNSRGELSLKSARYENIDRCVVDLKTKLATLILAALTAKPVNRAQVTRRSPPAAVSHHLPGRNVRPAQKMPLPNAKP